MRVGEDLEAETAYCIVNAGVVVGQFLGVEDVIPVYAAREVFAREIGSGLLSVSM